MCLGLGCCAACTACSCCVSLGKSVVTRGSYVAIFVVLSFIAWILSNWAEDMLGWIPELKNCPHDDCYGALAVFRITFSLSLFHFILSLIMINVKSSQDPRAALQNGWWLIKLPALVGIIVLSFIIPNSFFKYYEWVALFGAGFFVLIQLVLLVDFAYTWNETWVEKMEANDDKKWFYALLGSSFAMFAGALALSILLYSLFCSGEGCWLNILFVTINLVACTIITCVSISPKVQESGSKTGLLQSSIVTLYATYLVFSAVLSEPNEDGFNCNPFSSSSTKSSTHNVSLIIGAVLTIIAVCYSTIRASSSGDKFVGSSNGAYKALKEEEGASTESADKVEQVDDEVEGVSYNYSFFHVAFLLGAMYVGMLLTNWSTISGSSDKLIVDSGFVAVWVKIVTSWLALILYGWSVVAPIVLPDRDWS